MIARYLLKISLQKIVFVFALGLFLGIGMQIEAISVVSTASVSSKTFKIDHEKNGMVYLRDSDGPKLGIATTPNEALDVSGSVKLNMPVLFTIGSPLSSAVNWETGGVKKIALGNNNIGITMTGAPVKNAKAVDINEEFVVHTILIIETAANAAGSITSWAAPNHILKWKNNTPPVGNVLFSRTSASKFPIYFTILKRAGTQKVEYYGDY